MISGNPCPFLTFGPCGSGLWSAPLVGVPLWTEVRCKRTRPIHRWREGSSGHGLCAISEGIRRACPRSTRMNSPRCPPIAPDLLHFQKTGITHALTESPNEAVRLSCSGHLRHYRFQQPTGFQSAIPPVATGRGFLHPLSSA